MLIQNEGNSTMKYQARKRGKIEFEMDVVMPKEYKFFRCIGRETYIAFMDENRNYLVKDIAVGFRNWLKLYNPVLNSIAPNFVDEVIPALHSKALWGSDHAIEKYSRIAMRGKKLIYNLNGECSTVIEPGRYSLVHNYQLLDEELVLLKNDVMGDQCFPRESNGKQLLNLSKLLSLDEKDSCLLSMLIVSFFNPNVEKPVICLDALDYKGKAMLNYVFQALVDPLSEMGYYLPPYGDKAILDKRYLFNVTNQHSLSDVSIPLTFPLFGNRPCYDGMRKCCLVNSMDTDNLLSVAKKCVVTLDSPMTGSNFKSFSHFKEAFDKLVPYLLDEIFETLGIALAFYHPLTATPKKVLDEYFNWVSCVSFALYEDGDIFSDAIAAKKI